MCDSCYECSCADYLKEIAELERKLEEERNETAMVAQGIRHYPGCSNITGEKDQPCIRCELEDYNSIYKEVIEEACKDKDTGMVHCTCVPWLRMKIKEQDEELKKLNEELEALKEYYDHRPDF
jgi:hypothetical protein